jgi:hypothetical protein
MARVGIAHHDGGVIDPEEKPVAVVPSRLAFAWRELQDFQDVPILVAEVERTELGQIQALAAKLHADGPGARAEKAFQLLERFACLLDVRRLLEAEHLRVELRRPSRVGDRQADAAAAAHERAGRRMRRPHAAARSARDQRGKGEEEGPTGSRMRFAHGHWSKPPGSTLRRQRHWRRVYFPAK